jgi:LPS-assembly lipoprotein
MRYEIKDKRYKPTRRLAAVVPLYLVPCILYLFLSGCGFHLRGASSVALPPELSTLRVTMGSGGYPPLLVEVRNALLALGNVQLTDDVSASVPVLQLHSESSVRQVLAIDSSGRISAYLLNYRVDYLLLGANSKPLLPRQSVKLQREYAFDRLNVLATEKQTEFLQHEMRRDVAQQILRRLASLNSATARDGGSAESAGAVSPPRDSEDHADQR